MGKAKANKAQAEKSAAYEAVKYLYQGKYIREDLRSKRYEELEEEKEIEKFEDLEFTKKNK
jgi:hypothetical protein